MAIIQNKDIYDPSQGDPFAPINEALELLDKKAISLKKTMISLEDVIKNSSGKSGKDYKDTSKAAEDLATSTNKLITLEQSMAKIVAAKENAKVKLSALNSKEAKELSVLNQKIAEQNRLNKIGDSSYKQLSATLNDLRTKYKDLAASGQMNTKESKELLNEITKLDKKLKQIEGAVGQHHRNVGNYLGALKKWGGQILAATGITVGIGAVVSGFKDAFIKIKEFETALSDLKAITGASGKDLEFLSDKALELARNYGISGKDAVNAMKLVGSAKPELLGNVKALGQTTEAVLVLSKASRAELAPTTEAVTTIMNQFGLSAEQSERTINALAAGSKYGAVEVDYLSQAISKVGTVADAAGLTLEQTVAVMELFGEKGIKAETAGNGFKKILVELQKDTKNYKDGVFDLNLAIDNNASISGDNIALQKKFGSEFFTLAQILFQNKDRFLELNEQVTGTNTAFEQAAIQMDNLSGDLDKATGAWDSFILSLESGDGVLSRVTRNAVKGFSAVLNMLTALNDGRYNEYWRDEVSKLVGATEDFNKVYEATAKKILLQADALKQQELAQKFVNKYENESMLLKGQAQRLMAAGKKESDNEVAKLLLMARGYELLSERVKQYTDVKKVPTGGDDGDGDDDKKKGGVSIDTRGFEQGQREVERQTAEMIREYEKRAAAIDDINKKLAEKDVENAEVYRDMAKAESEWLNELGDEDLEKELQRQAMYRSAIGETFAVASAEFSRLLVEGELTALEFGKMIINTALTAAEKLLEISIAQIYAKQIADKQFAGIATAAILTGIVKGAFAGLRARVSKWAGGTEYVDGAGTETSDSIPAYLSKGERVVPAAINKQLFIPNKDLPKVVNAGLQFLKMEKFLANIYANGITTNNYLSNGQNVWTDGNFLYTKDWRTGVVKRKLND